MTRRIALAALAAAGALLPSPAAAQTVYLAFGDSITAGAFDDAGAGGYPARLEELLDARGVPAVVENHGFPGETTAEALSRVDDVLDRGGDVLLLMEGTNDIKDLSPESIAFNIAAIADRAEARGLDVVHGTIIPRHPSSGFDGTNRGTRAFNGLVREIAWENGRNLADPFYVFFHDTPDVFSTLYADNLHPNAEGYDLLAELWADVLTGRDEVPPVIGRLSPFDDQQNTPANAPIEIDLYDFGTGIAVSATRLLIDGEPVEATIAGNERRQTIRYAPPQPWSGVVFVDLEARDRASPANERSGQLLQFVVEGAQFLAGDIDRDGRVDGVDLVTLAFSFGTQRGMAQYRGVADLNDDDRVDGEDLAILASNFGQRSF